MDCFIKHIKLFTGLRSLLVYDNVMNSHCFLLASYSVIISSLFTCKCLDNTYVILKKIVGRTISLTYAQKILSWTCPISNDNEHLSAKHSEMC